MEQSKIAIYLKKLLAGKGINISNIKDSIFDKFITEEGIEESVDSILNLQEQIMATWTVRSKVLTFKDLSIMIPNGTENVEYSYSFEPNFFSDKGIVQHELHGLEQYGLSYDKKKLSIQGVPNAGGNFEIRISFQVEGEKYRPEPIGEQPAIEEKQLAGSDIESTETDDFIMESDANLLVEVESPTIELEIKIEQTEEELLESNPEQANLVEKPAAGSHDKVIYLVVNPDPKSLWKNIDSDKDAIFWKEDNESASASVGEKSIIISSKRGRSHQNVGSFRDDDFAFKHFEETGWTVVAVSDGAGSYPMSRKGSELACHEVINSFEEIMAGEELAELETTLKENPESPKASILVQAKKLLYKVSLHVHAKLGEVAEETFVEHPELFTHPKAKSNLDYFHSTLIFAAFKKFDVGYLILTFGVGDCPIGIVNKDQTEAKLLNWLDVGEFGGGTRFITQRDIFHSEKRPMASRFDVHIQDDFSFLFLMTDGIYDPKFVVEANLEKTEKWLEFIKDLEGDNEDSAKVDFEAKLKETEEQLNKWMDFWSKGNHDDRTLAIIY